MDTKNLEREFHVSRYIIIYKFFLGLIELALGLGIVFFGKQAFRIYYHFRSQELFEDPHDLLGRLLEKVVPYISEHRGYIVFFLIVLGLTKIIGAIGLLYRKHWGLDLLVGLTIILLPFEVFNLLIHLSLSKFIFILINILITLYLVNFKPREYILRLKHRTGIRDNPK